MSARREHAHPQSEDEDDISRQFRLNDPSIAAFPHLDAGVSAYGPYYSLNDEYEPISGPQLQLATSAHIRLLLSVPDVPIPITSRRQGLANATLDEQSGPADDFLDSQSEAPPARYNHAGSLNQTRTPYNLDRYSSVDSQSDRTSQSSKPVGRAITSTSQTPVSMQSPIASDLQMHSANSSMPPPALPSTGLQAIAPLPISVPQPVAAIVFPEAVTAVLDAPGGACQDPSCRRQHASHWVLDGILTVERCAKFCEVCGKSFGAVASVRRHVRTKHCTDSKDRNSRKIYEDVYMADGRPYKSVNHSRQSGGTGPDSTGTPGPDESTQ